MIIFATFVATALAQYDTSSYSYSAPNAHAPESKYTPIPYKFEYSVNDPHTKDVHSRSEYSDGNGHVKGSYSLLEADGSTRIVEYTADHHNGFNAEVKKIGGAASYESSSYPSKASYLSYY